jgi:hypothetical protein
LDLLDVLLNLVLPLQLEVGHGDLDQVDLVKEAVVLVNHILD